MSSKWKKPVKRHVVAYAASLIARVMGFSAAVVLLGWDADPPFFACCFQCAFSLLAVAILVFPITLVGELVLVRWLKWRWWAHVPAMTLAYSLVGFLVWVVWPLRSGDSLDTGLVAAGLYDVVLPGIAYWLMLRVAEVWLDTASL